MRGQHPARSSSWSWSPHRPTAAAAELQNALGNQWHRLSLMTHEHTEHRAKQACASAVPVLPAGAVGALGGLTGLCAPRHIRSCITLICTMFQGRTKRDASRITCSAFFACRVTNGVCAPRTMVRRPEGLAFRVCSKQRLVARVQRLLRLGFCRQLLRRFRWL
jgi:hypothetical protein